MNRKSCWLLEFGHNVYSQAGEDGVIAKVLETLPATDKWCVEFGAWDGQHLSNTRNLIEKSEYSSILIEGDELKFGDLRNYYKANPRITTFNRYVGFKDHDNLDSILANTPITIDFDLLSIDIDGNDYHVWEALKKYHPKVVVIEFNPTIPTEVAFVQPADITVNQGSSLLSLVDLAMHKGYSLVSVLPFNAIFVKSEFFSLFDIEDNHPETLRTDCSNITHIFSGYDGTVFLAGSKILPWHGISLDQSKFQILPRRLRKYPHSYSKIQRVLVGLLTRPRYLIRKFFSSMISS